MKTMDKQQAVILIAAVVMLTGFGGLRYWPVFRQRQALAAKMQDQQVKMEEFRAYSSLLPELRHQNRQLQESVCQFSRRIPQGQDFAGLWQQISDAMNTCRLNDQWVQPGQEVKLGQFSCIPLMIECKGSAQQIFDFFKAVEAMDRLIRVEEVNLENSADFKADLKLKAKVSVYYQS